MNIKIKRMPPPPIEKVTLELSGEEAKLLLHAIQRSLGYVKSSLSGDMAIQQTLYCPLKNAMEDDK